MAITNQDRVGKAMELLREGVAPYIEREVQEAVKAGSVRMDSIRRFSEDPMLGTKPIGKWDVAGLLKLSWETWNDVFARTLGRAERSLVQELRDWRPFADPVTQWQPGNARIWRTFRHASGRRTAKARATPRCAIENHNCA